MDFNAYTFLSKVTLKIMVAIVIVLLGTIFAGFFGKLTLKIIQELELDKVLKQGTKIRLSLENLLPPVVKYLIYSITILFALESLGWITTMVYIVLGFLLLIVIILVAFSIKDSLPNLTAGTIIHRQIKIGNFITIGSVSGEVVEFTSTDVKVLTKKKELFLIPNSMFLKQEFKIRK